MKSIRVYCSRSSIDNKLVVLVMEMKRDISQVQHILSKMLKNKLKLAYYVEISFNNVDKSVL